MLEQPPPSSAMCIVILGWRGMSVQMSWPTRAGWHTPDGASSCGTRRRQRAGHQWWSARRVELRSQCLLVLHQHSGRAVCESGTVPSRCILS